jgi:hypothetical protein
MHHIGGGIVTIGCIAISKSASAIDYGSPACSAGTIHNIFRKIISIELFGITFKSR